MKKPDITPGPWDTSRDAVPEGYAQNTVYAENGSRVATVFQTANARAIAALPELLEALEGLMADKYLSDPINADRMAPARSALRKAGYTI